MTKRPSSQAHRTPTGRFYAGRTIHSDPGVHDRVLELVRERIARPARIADLGAGSGAFTACLLAGGYDVLGIDLRIDTESAGLPIISADLCEELAPELFAQFDAVVAIEVIEHVSDISRFLGNARRLLRPGGLVWLTTPNVTHPYSRLKFVAKGRYLLFDEEMYWRTGHSAPLPPWLLELHVARAGFSDVERGLCGVYPGVGLRKLAFTLLRPVAARSAGALGARDDCISSIVCARNPMILPQPRI